MSIQVPLLVIDRRCVLVMSTWFSKTEGNTYATIAASPFPLKGKPTQAQDVATDDKGNNVCCYAV